MDVGLRALDAMSLFLLSTRRSDVDAPREIVVEGVGGSVLFKGELHTDSISRGLDERESWGEAERSMFGVGLVGAGWLSTLCLGGSIWCFFALRGVPLEKLMGKLVRP